MISHSEDKNFTSETGEEYQQIVPTLPKQPAKIVNRMADIIGYSRAVEDEATGNSSTVLFMRGKPRFMAGSRWKYTPDYIEFKYENLVNAIQDAIDKQSEEDGIQPLDKHVNIYKEEEVKDAKVVRAHIDEMIEKLKTSEENLPKISNIIVKHFGTGRHLDEAGQEQVDILLLIESDLEDLLAKAVESDEGETATKA